MQTLAIKYRPITFSDVTEQEAVKIILGQQLATNTIKNVYLFCGGAGTGKTTCARIFANEINKGEGNPIEMDAASNSGVEDVRNIIQQAKTKSLDSEYKVFIIDECHSISNTGWQAFLKLIEEPPAKSIFIFCTTDPQKIPKTILSRVQRYDFQRISQQGIVDRLTLIIQLEKLGNPEIIGKTDAIEYIAKIADGGMRDAISLLDKCLAYSTELTIDNVIKAIGTNDYTVMMQLTDSLHKQETKEIVKIIEDIHSSGKDLKLFIRQFVNFVLDVCKYSYEVDYNYLGLPMTEDIKNFLEQYKEVNTFLDSLLEDVVKLNSKIKYSQYIKADVESDLLLFSSKE